MLLLHVMSEVACVVSLETEHSAFRVRQSQVEKAGHGRRDVTHVNLAEVPAGGETGAAEEKTGIHRRRVRKKSVSASRLRGRAHRSIEASTDAEPLAHPDDERRLRKA